MKNLVILTGFVGKDPEFKQTDTGVAVSRFSLATDDGYFDKNQDWQSITNWHTIVGWRKVADRINQDIKKGTKVQVIGKLTSREYTTAEGQKRWAVEVVINSFLIVAHKREQTSTPTEATGSQKLPGDDLPF